MQFPDLRHFSLKKEEVEKRGLMNKYTTLKFENKIVLIFCHLELLELLSHFLDMLGSQDSR